MKKLWVIFLLIVSCNLAFAQRKEIRLAEFIKKIESRFSITVSYDPEVMGDVKVSLDPNAGTLEEILKLLTKYTKFNFSSLGGGYVVAEPKPTKNLNICAYIYDEGSKEPLLGSVLMHEGKALIQLLDPNGKLFYSGKFLKSDSVQIFALGFLPKTLSIASISSGECPKFYMKSEVKELEKAEVTIYLTEGINELQNENGIQINVNELPSLPGETDGDILNSIKMLPGVYSTDSKAGNIYMRGSTPDQSLVMIDHIPVYHRGHYFGTISPFNPKIIDDVQVFRSGFHPRITGRVGGAININTDRSVPDSLRMGLGLNSIYGTGYAKVPIVNDKLSIMGSARGLLPINWTSPKQGTIEDMIYQASRIFLAQNADLTVLDNLDYNFRDLNSTINFKPSHSDQLFISGLNVFNKMDYTITENGVTSSAIVQYRSSGISGSWTHDFSDKLRLKSSFVYSDYKYNICTQDVDSSGVTDFEERNIVKDIEGAIEGSYFFDNGNSLEFGYDLMYLETRLVDYGGNQPGGITTLSDNGGFLNSVFANLNFTNLNKININSGLRINYFPNLDALNFEPRVFANYRTGKKTKVKGSFTITNQYLSQFETNTLDALGIDDQIWLLSGDDILIIKGRQGSIGTDYTTKSVKIDFEVYMKYLRDLPVYYQVLNNPNDIFIAGQLESFGGNILLRKSWKKLDAWVSYNLSQTNMYFDEISGSKFRAKYDQPHIVNIAGTFTHKKLKVSLGWFYKTGIPTEYWALIGLPTMPGPGPPAGEGLLNVYDKVDGSRMPDQHQLDFSASYSFAPKSKQWLGSVGILILNVYDRTNYYDVVDRVQPGNSSWVARTTIGFAPNLTVNIDW